MFASAVSADITPTEANESWRPDLRLLGWMLLFSLLVHLLLLWRLTGEKIYSVAPVARSTVAMAIRLQEQQINSHHNGTVSHNRHVPVHPAPLTAQEPVAEAKADAPPMVEADVSESVTASPDPAPAITKLSQAEQEENYLAQVRALIESHKFYPDSARRLGMQGSVQVSFVVNPDGSVSKVICRGGTRLLQLAAEQALRSAEPFPVQLSSAPRPLQVHYETTFALN